MIASEDRRSGARSSAVPKLGNVGVLALLLGVAAGVVAVEAWHGAVLLALSASHGVDAGDLPAVPFVVLAIAMARRRLDARARTLAADAPPTPPLALGVVLLLAGVPASEGGPLMPAGGGVLGGTVDPDGRCSAGVRSAAGHISR